MSVFVNIVLIVIGIYVGLYLAVSILSVIWIVIEGIFNIFVPYQPRYDKEVFKSFETKTKDYLQERQDALYSKRKYKVNEIDKGVAESTYQRYDNKGKLY